MAVILVLLGCACAVLGAPSQDARPRPVDLLMPNVEPKAVSARKHNLIYLLFIVLSDCLFKLNL